MALLRVAWHSAQSLSYDPFSIVATITLVTRVASHPYTRQGLEYRLRYWFYGCGILPVINLMNGSEKSLLMLFATLADLHCRKLG